MLKLDVSNISPRSDREATAGTLFQFIVYDSTLKSELNLN